MEQQSWFEEAVAGLGFSGLVVGAIAVLHLGTGCTTIGHDRVDGWPTLEVVEHHVPHHEMRDRCAKYAPWGSYPEACAEFNLTERRCDIWFSADFPPTAAFIEHERLHCAGYDHVGEGHMAQLLAAYNATAPRAEVRP